MRTYILGLLLAIVVAGCTYGSTAAYVTGGGNTVYCRPINQDLQHCYDDYGHTWSCQIIAGEWSCRETTPVSYDPYWGL